MKEIKIPNNSVVYISGPMTGRDWEQVQKEFNIYSDLFTNLGFNVINPCGISHSDPSNWKLILQEDFIELGTADYIFMIPGWRDSKGCCAEWGYAQAMGITPLYGSSIVSIEEVFRL